MQRKVSQVVLLPSFVKLRTVPLFTKIATRFAMAKKVIAEIRKVEDFLVGGRVTKDQLRMGLREISDFSNTVAIEADNSLVAVREMRKRVAAYRQELSNAVG